jgi:hypothetical protein
MKTNQETIAGVNEKRIAGKMKKSDAIYMSGENHGETYYGTMDQWERIIPKNEKQAKSTGYYDWYMSDDRRDEGMEWDEYRDEIIDQLVRVEIVPG